MRRVAAWFSGVAEGYAAVFANGNLRRSQLAWASAVTAEWAFFVGISVFAYQEGGTLGVGLVGLIRMLPSAVIGPFASALGDRYRRDRVVLGLFAAMGVAVALAAVTTLGNAPALLVYILAGVHATASTLSRPAQWALLPSLSRTPEELVAANGATMTTENLGTLAGPALGGILLAATDVSSLFGACSLVYLASAVTSFVHVEGERREQAPESIVGELLGGFHALARERGAAFLIALFCAQTLVRGALSVFVVVASIRLLDMGESGVGFLTAAIGAGGLIGAFASLSLAGRRLAAPVAFGLVAWGAPIVAIGIWPDAAVALLMMALIGAGNSVLDVSGLTLLQRLVPNDVLSRVLGVLWGVAMAMVGVGSIVAAPLISGLGIRTALIVTGAFLPALVALSWRRLVAIDSSASIPTDQLAALQSVPMLAHLSLVAKEEIASMLAPMTVEPNEEVIREGDAGDRFYILVAGDVDVSSAGESIVTRSAPDYFGEIALLRDVPRTATVRARTELRLFALGREDFLAAVTEHAAGREASHTVLDERLATASSS
jgi:predicted MFS family arabinose efflux permease